MLVIVTLCLILTIVLGVLWYVYKRYMFSKKLIMQNEKLSKQGKNLKLLREELEERIQQTSEIMRMLHHSELVSTAEDIVNQVRAAAEGKYRMGTSDWQRLYQAVDSLYPEFCYELVRNLKKFNEQQKQVCYLLRIGLTNTQIENITDLSHATVWRWGEKIQRDYSVSQPEGKVCVIKKGVSYVAITVLSC